RLSSSMQGGSRAAPDVDGERKEQRQATREGSDHAIAPERDARIEPPEAAVSLDRDYLAEKLRRIDDVDARESVTFGQELISRAVDHAVHEEPSRRRRSEEHTSELQSRENLVCRLLLEKKNTTTYHPRRYSSFRTGGETRI